MLCPVHIGTGEVHDPFSLVMKEGRLHRIDLEDLLLHLSEQDRQTALALIDQGSLTALRQRLGGWFDPKRHPSRWSVGLQASFAREYQERISADVNQLQVFAHRRHGPNGIPYLPGSSIKGALRTAVLAARTPEQVVDTEGRPVDTSGKHYRDFEPAVLGYRPGHLHRDPFRALKISDAEFLGGDPMTVGRVINRGLREHEAPPIPMNFEFARGVLMGMDKGADFRCEVTLDEFANAEGGFQRPLSIEEIIGCANQFYQDNLAEERARFHLAWNLQGVLKPLYTTAGGLKTENKQFLLRVGRFSHLENLTVRPPHRHAYSPQLRREIEDSSSRSLAEDRWPFGWVVCLLQEQR
jgi:CRISPR type III-A-associated RAMP protein Csm5